jgi:hypothetical protein
LCPDKEFDMLRRATLGFVALTLSLLLAGCAGDRTLKAIQVTPSKVLTPVGENVQFKAFGIYSRAGGNYQITVEITNQVQWSSILPQVATIDSGGLATSVGPGLTSISASMKGDGGSLIIGNASFEVD